MCSKRPGFSSISGNSLFIFVYIPSFFFYGSVCVYLCVFMSAFFKAPYRISTFTDSQSTEQPHPPSLCFCRWTAHLAFMKQGSKLSVSPLWTTFILPAVQLHCHVSAGETAQINVDLDNEWNKNKSILPLFLINLCHRLSSTDIGKPN